MRLASTLPFFLLGIMSVPSAVWAQDVVLADLIGKKIEHSRTEQRVARIKDTVRKQTATVFSQILVSADGSYKLSELFSIDDEKKGVTKKNWSLSGQLGQPASYRDGKVIFVFEGGALIRLRTMGEGGVKTEIKFQRTDKGLTCQYKHAFAQEVGVGKTTSKATNTGNVSEILSVKPVGTSCKVT